MSVSATSSVRPSNPIDSLIPQLPSENAETASSKSSDSTASKSHHIGMFGADDDSPSFWDLVDVINPLQHIPLVNEVYRELSGDKIGIAARLTGGALFGGVIGLIGATVSGVIEESTGDSAGGHMLALFRDDPATGDSGTALAEAAPPAQAQPPTEKTAEAQPQTIAANDTKTDTKTDARPIVLTDMIGEEPAPPAAMPRPAVSASASAAPVAAAQQTAAKVETPPAAISIADTGDVAATRPMWGGKSPRTLTMPSRTTELATRTPPAVATSISGNSGRSPLPVTGSRPQSGLIAPTNTAPVVAAQSESTATTTTEAAKTTAAAANPAPAGNDWFTAAMAEGLNKYQRSNARAAATDQTITP
ncbi:hypothetical protein [Magnetospirillum molischianum]|uniref:Uncharacterized protein n=1 Tax=Magnetospirillum molischianum DSM 120 TaxID=1150626 RepID=H8FUR3_MAGML|nr:hypothetical protein [Magnetospirillum molischianum]CCG42101.1 conserved hypothetical protein [Magnetospirillum molischianum DSM 120]